MNKTCSECRWFVVRERERGLCYFAPPTLVVESDLELDGVYAVSRRPLVQTTDFCAQWAPAEGA
jgi:hypothetical protein